MVEKETTIKTPSVTAVNRVIMGFSLGFAVSFPITFARYPLVLFLVGIAFLAAGIVLVIVGKNGTKRIAATAALVLIVGASLLPAFTVSISAAELPEGFVDLVGDGVKGMMGDAADDAFKNALTENAEVTKGTLVDGAKTLTGDLIKDGLDDSFKTPGEE